jgi:hypothetical protein
VVQFDDLHRLWIAKVTKGWIYKGQMTIFTDSQYGEIWWVIRQQSAIPFGFSNSIVRITAQSMELANGDLINKTINQKTSERLRCAIVHSEIFVQMEGNNFGPVKVRSFCECRQKFILRRRGRKDTYCPPASFD